MPIDAAKHLPPLTIDELLAAFVSIPVALQPPPFDHLGQALTELAHCIDELENEDARRGSALTYAREAIHHLRKHRHEQLLMIEQPTPDPGPLIDMATQRAQTDRALVLAAAIGFGPSQVESIRRNGYRRDALPYAQGWADCLAYLAERAAASQAASQSPRVLLSYDVAAPGADRTVIAPAPVRHGVDCRKAPHPLPGMHPYELDGPFQANDATYCGRCHALLHDGHARAFSGLAETFAMIDRARSAMGRDEVVLRDGRKVRVTLSSADGVRLVSWQLGEAESTQGDCVAALDADFAGMRMTDGGLA